MTDEIDELITKYYEKHANFIAALDSLDVDPIFKWCIKRRLQARDKDKKDQKKLLPTYDIVKDFLEYHINSENSFGFKLKLFGIPSPSLRMLRERLRGWFDERFKLHYEELVFAKPYPYTTFICLTERGKGEEDILRELKEREAVITLELMAWHRDDNTLCRCIVHDMFFNKLGFVDIKCD